MLPRLQLQTILENVLGSRNVYFQPPPSFSMAYPCIVYNREDVDTKYASNLPYRRKKKYQVTVIDQDPDSDIPDRVGALASASHNRFFTANNLNHDVYTLFF